MLRRFGLRNKLPRMVRPGFTGGAGGRPIVVPLWRDNFDTSRAAGAVNGTPAEPGPGNRFVTDTESKFSISGGQLVSAGGKAVPASGDPGYWTPSSYARVAGRTMCGTVTPQAAGVMYGVGWDDSQAGISADSLKIDSSMDVSPYIAAAYQCVVERIVAGTTYQFAVVQRSSGCYFLIKGGVFTNWRLIWVSTEGSVTPRYGCVNNFSKLFTADDLKIFDLAAPWTDYGIATQRLAGVRAQGNTFVHEADFIIEFVVNSLPGAGQWDYIDVRKQDDNNKWMIYFDSTGQLNVGEVINGVPAYRAGIGAGTLVPGSRCVIRFSGTNIRGYINNALYWNFNGAVNFQTATNGAIRTLAAPCVVSDLITWPKNIGGAALAALSAYTW